MILVTQNSEPFAVLVETNDVVGENPDAVGTEPGVSGATYHGVKAWVAPGLLEPDEMHVFVEWTDKSSSVPSVVNPGRVHTLERPLPGGGMGPFLVTASA
jgi:hypothetical protein